MLIAVDSVGAEDDTVFMLVNLRCIRIFLRTKYAAIIIGRRMQEQRVKMIVINANSIVYGFSSDCFCKEEGIGRDLYRIVRSLT